MTNFNGSDDRASTSEIESVYNFVGRYVIVFQEIEGRIDEILILARGQERRGECLSWLAKKTFEVKLTALKRTLKAEQCFRTSDLEGWNEMFQSVIWRLDAERLRRNGILHSRFLFDFMAIGSPVLRTHVKRKKGEDAPYFDQEYLSQAKRDKITSEIVQLAFDLGQLHVQLSHLQV